MSLPAFLLREKESLGSLLRGRTDHKPLLQSFLFTIKLLFFRFLFCKTTPELIDIFGSYHINIAMNDCNTEFPVLTSTLSYEVDERSPAFENHCQYNCPSLTIKNGCEDNSKETCFESSNNKPCFEQSLNSGAESLEENGSVVTAHFVSNGYYGFQPLTLTMVTELDCQMDVGDLNAVEGAEGSSCHETIANGTSFEPYRWQSQLTGNKSPPKGLTVLGKRNWDGVTEIHSEVKRIRQEEPASLTLCLYKGIDYTKMSVDFNETPFSQKNVDCHYPRCNISQYV